MYLAPNSYFQNDPIMSSSVSAYSVLDELEVLLMSFFMTFAIPRLDTRTQFPGRVQYTGTRYIQLVISVSPTTIILGAEITSTKCSKMKSPLALQHSVPKLKGAEVRADYRWKWHETDN